jgi:inhibitor of cysteine peptidase
VKKAQLFGVVVLVALIGCGMEEPPIDEGSGVGGKADDGSREPGLVIDESGNGLTFDVLEGESVIVRLPSNPSTGYEWQVVSTDRTFGYPATVNFIPSPLDVGEGGITELVWKTGGALSLVGSHTVTLEYRRPWEDPVQQQPVDAFTFTVVVHAETAGS